MIQTVGLGAFKEFNRPSVIAVGVPLMIIAGIATHFNSRASVARQSPEAAANPADRDDEQARAVLLPARSS